MFKIISDVLDFFMEITLKNLNHCMFLRTVNRQNLCAPVCDSFYFPSPLLLQLKGAVCVSASDDAIEARMQTGLLKITLSLF